METIKISTLLILFISSLILLYWVYRPGTKSKYEEYSNIPLKNDKDFKVNSSRKKLKKKLTRT